MPSYAKFLKDILSNKRKIEEHATVALTEECSAILQHKLPPKLKDPGSFTIPIQIGNYEFGKSLCDLGASINLMPLSIFRKLGLGEVQPTNMILQLADRSINYPYGVIEDVLVKVGQLYLPADFVILDIDEDEEIPLILGRPFLATGGALIDVKGGKITLRVGGEKAVFNVFHASKGNTENSKCLRVDVMDSTRQQEHSKQHEEDELMKAVGGLESNAEKEIVIKSNTRPSLKDPAKTTFEDRRGQTAKSEPLSKSPKFKKKPDPDHPKHAHLGENETFKMKDQHFKPFNGEEMVGMMAKLMHKPTE